MSIFDYFCFVLNTVSGPHPPSSISCQRNSSPTRCDVSGRMAIRGTKQRSAFGVQRWIDVVAARRTNHGLAFSAAQCDLADFHGAVCIFLAWWSAALSPYIEKKAPAAGSPNSSPATNVCL